MRQPVLDRRCPRPGEAGAGDRGAGNTWPSGGQYLPEKQVGKTSTDLDADEVIWKFFAAHSLPAPPPRVSQEPTAYQVTSKARAWIQSSSCWRRQRIRPPTAPLSRASALNVRCSTAIVAKASPRQLSSPTPIRHLPNCSGLSRSASDAHRDINARRRSHYLLLDDAPPEAYPGLGPGAGIHCLRRLFRLDRAELQESKPRRRWRLRSLLPGSSPSPPQQSRGIPLHRKCSCSDSSNTNRGKLDKRDRDRCSDSTDSIRNTSRDRASQEPKPSPMPKPNPQPRPYP